MRDCAISAGLPPPKGELERELEEVRESRLLKEELRESRLLNDEPPKGDPKLDPEEKPEEKPEEMAAS